MTKWEHLNVPAVNQELLETKSDRNLLVAAKKVVSRHTQTRMDKLLAMTVLQGLIIIKKGLVLLLIVPYVQR